MIKHKFYSILFIVSAIFLGACNSDDIDSSSASVEDLSSYPEGVQNGNVSAEYYDGMMTVIVEYINLLDTIKTDIKDYNSIKESGMEFLTTATLNDILPTTSAEQDIDEYYSDYLIKTKNATEYFIKYATEKDEFYLDMANSYREDVNLALEMIYEIGEKYDIE